MGVSTLSLCLSRFLATSVLFSSLVAPAAYASKTRNAAILARVLSFELTLDERVGPSIGVAVVYKVGDAASEANADEWMQALGELSSVRIKDRPFFAAKIPYGPNELTKAIDKQGVDVLLIADGLMAEAPAIAQLARAKHVLSASNAAAFVEKDITLCVTNDADKTKIVINLRTAQMEGIRFSSNLLKLASIIR